MRNLLVPMLLVALLATACAEGDDAGETTTTGPAQQTTTTQLGTPVQQGELARADVDRATETDATSDEIAALVGGDAEFAFDLFRLLAADGENTLLSPYSIAAALTMTYAGARGDTASQLAEALYFAVSGDRIHTLRNELDLRISLVPDPLEGDDREPFEIRVANSLWGQAGYPFLEEFLVLLAENYDAGMNLVDFATAAEEARVAINTWVEEQTEGRIVDLIPQGIINDLTRLVLVNAIWFKASWQEQFDPENTADGTFNALDGTSPTVPFMSGGGMMPYAAGDGYQLLRIPYAGDAAMVVVLPDEGRFEEIVGSLDAAFLDAASAQAAVREINLVMPKFEFKSEFSLKEALAELGIEDAFDPGSADFTGITERRELFVQEVVHQAFITVDETGTEAAAATAVIAGLTSVADPPLPVTMDRPFVFLIEHGSTGEILFLGQVTNPAG